MAWLVLYSIIFVAWRVDSKWERDYQKYLSEKIIHPQKEVLNSEADKDMTKRCGGKYIGVMGSFGRLFRSRRSHRTLFEKVVRYSGFDGTLEKKR